MGAGAAAPATAGGRQGAARKKTGAARAKTGAGVDVTFTPAGASVRVPVGTSLLDAAAAAGVDIPAPCGGQGRCGRCLVSVTEGEVEQRSSAHLSAEDAARGTALACQSFVAGPATIDVPRKERETVRVHGPSASAPERLPVACDWKRDPAVCTLSLRIEPPSLSDNTSDLDRLRRELARRYEIGELRAELTILRQLGAALRAADWKIDVTLEMREWVYDTYLPPRLIAITPSGTERGTYGLAIDVGTTSVVGSLVDFRNGAIKATAGAYNRQMECGDDVISRIVYSQRGAGLLRLQRLVLETINEVVDDLAARGGVHVEDIHEIALAGNTTMVHLLLGLDPKYLREEPYIPTISAAPKLVAAELGLHTNPQARVNCLPSVGSYVGGDITAGVISSGMYATDKLTLFIDIGTNGEIVLGNGEWLIACACSAGPAFEGGGVGHGMRATRGAIEDIWVNAETYEPTFATIDGAAPAGICGSGLIDLLGELFATGVLDKSGTIDRRLADITPRVRVADKVAEYVVAWGDETSVGRDIVLTESDITGLLRAKAAIYAGYSVLCRSVGVDLADVEQFLVGGAFGEYLDVEKAILIGLLPDLPVERFRFLGNTSAQGAYMALLCVGTRRDIAGVAARMTYLELSADNTFMDEYTSALFLPHTDLEVFPTVKALLEQRPPAHVHRPPTHAKGPSS